MSRELYEILLQSRLQELISKNPDRARELLTSSVEHCPDLYEIAMDSNSKDWPARILACGQMQMLLNRIDWSKGTILNLPECDLPGPEELTEALPQ